MQGLEPFNQTLKAVVCRKAVGEREKEMELLWIPKTRPFIVMTILLHEFPSRNVYPMEKGIVYFHWVPSVIYTGKDVQ